MALIAGPGTALKEGQRGLLHADPLGLDGPHSETGIPKAFEALHRSTGIPEGLVSEIKAKFPYENEK